MRGIETWVKNSGTKTLTFFAGLETWEDVGVRAAGSSATHVKPQTEATPKEERERAGEKLSPDYMLESQIQPHLRLE